jgi:hypothetical protein
MRLLKAQEQIAKDNFQTTLFVEGIAGTGKTTAAIERIKQLLRDGTRPDSILVLVPQATLATPYRGALKRARVDGGSDVHTATLGKLAQQAVELFFPLIAEQAGFANPLSPPHFLSLELVQYYMMRFVEPEIEERDYFNSVHITRNRLYTQIVDNLNKSALVGFDHQRIAHKLKSAWRGDVSQQYIYDDAQAAATRFREMCEQHNIVDFSLQMTLFTDYLWHLPQVQAYFTRQYRHLIVDNIEEDTPALHDILHDWLPQADSATVLYDLQGGYRRFLGADPRSAYQIKEHCAQHVTLDNHRVMSNDMQALQIEVADTLSHPLSIKYPKDAEARQALVYADDVHRYHNQMIDWVCDNVANLINVDGVDPAEIVILAPYLPDALRFSLQTRLNERQIPNRTHRPSRALREEPAARTLLTLAKLAHPHWQLDVSPYDVAHALTNSITELDLVRARLLVEVLYRQGELAPFERINDEAMQKRITFELGIQYDALYTWLSEYQAQDVLPVDLFFSKLFGEVLSQAGYNFHSNIDAANTAANLVDSARQFRQTVQAIEPDRDTSLDYIQMVDRGVIANQYQRDWETEKRSAVLIAPAYTFLLSNLPVDYQFWLNVGSAGWSQRLHQPLTHPYVLSRQWPEGRIWTDDDEVIADQQTLTYLTLGLIRRCRQQIYLGISQFGEQGYEQKGTLLMTIQAMLRRLQKESVTHV